MIKKGKPKQTGSTGSDETDWKRSGETENKIK